MSRSLLGVGVHDFRMKTKAALSCAAGMGFGAVEILAASGDTSPDELSRSGRRHLERLVRGLGLELSALAAATPGGGSVDLRQVDERIARTKAVLDLARDMSVSTVTVTLGAITADDDRATAVGVLGEVGDHADRTGRILAVHMHGQSPASLESIIEELRCPSVRVCVDPAAMLMVGHDPIEGIARLAGNVGLSYARDSTLGHAGSAGHETRLGDGQLDLAAYLTALDGAAYGGPQIVRCTSAENPLEDIGHALSVLGSHR